MGYVFTGATKRIDLTLGTVAVDVKDLFSRWKDWVLAGNAQWPQAFSCVGGEEIGTGVYITTYAFLLNGWHVHPQEANHKVEFSGGVILTDSGDDPIALTAGAFNVQVQYSQPIKTETVATGGVNVNDVAAAVWVLIGGSGRTTLASLELAANEATSANTGIQTVNGKVDTVLADVTLLRKMESGRWKIVANQMIFYDEDGVTPLRTFDLKDQSGAPSMTSVFERVPA
jgi:hypothetical protein